MDLGEFRVMQNWIGPPGCLIADASYSPAPADLMLASVVVGPTVARRARTAHTTEANLAVGVNRGLNRGVITGSSPRPLVAVRPGSVHEWLEPKVGFEPTTVGLRNCSDDVCGVIATVPACVHAWRAIQYDQLSSGLQRTLPFIVKRQPGRKHLDVQSRFEGDVLRKDYPRLRDMPPASRPKDRADDCRSGTASDASTPAPPICAVALSQRVADARRVASRSNQPPRGGLSRGTWGTM